MWWIFVYKYPPKLSRAISVVTGCPQSDNSVIEEVVSQDSTQSAPGI